MFKTFTFLFVTFLLLSCGKSGGGGTATNSDGESISTSDISVDSPVPGAAQNFEVNVKLDNFDSAQEDKILAAADLIKKVIASKEFKNAILLHSYNGKKTFIDNGGRSNAEIYKMILDGKEKLLPKLDNEMDLELEVFRRNDNVVGYTLPNVIRVWMNSKFLDRNSPAEVTTNMMHEWLHKLGFGHSQTLTPTRKYSVPYAIGYLMAKLAKQIQ